MEDIIKLFGGAENIWNSIQQNADQLGLECTRMLLELFYVLKSPGTGFVDKTVIVAALGYQLLPEDVMPKDEHGILGFLDNGAALAIAYNRVKASVTPEIETQVNTILSSWFGEQTANQQTFGIPSNANPAGEYTAQPIANPQPFKSRPNTFPAKPTWNDDEDVVID